MKDFRNKPEEAKLLTNYNLKAASRTKTVPVPILLFSKTLISVPESDFQPVIKCHANNR